MSELVVSDVHKAYGATQVLKGLSLDIPGGQIFAVLGSSGSGKTTLLRAIAGFESIDKGSITVNGRLVADARNHLAPERRGVAIVPQDQALFPHLTVAKNIGFGVARSERKNRTAEMLTFAGLDGLGERMPNELSGGQQQRVALARALAPRPALVLLDEPFTGLDAALRATIRENISTLLRAAGTTVVLVTHDQEEALSIADQVAVLRDGRVVQVGEPSQVYRAPRDLGVGSFVGDANVVDGTVTDGHVTCVLGQLTTDEAVPNGASKVLVRPEQIELIEGTAATVIDRLYYGHDAMVIVELDGGEHIRVRAHGELPERSAAVGLNVVGNVVCFPA